VAYLAACTIYRDHAHELQEWIEFHRLVGVERFFLYDNGSQDNHREVLAPYVEHGIAELRHWPQHPGLREAFDHCVKTHAEEARWIAFLDIDDFLFSLTGRPVSYVLRDYESYPGVGVNRLAFGTSGHRTRPEGLVIENFTRRSDRPDGVKSIVNPQKVLRCMGAHHFRFQGDALAVDELRRPITPENGFMSETPTSATLRIHHYSFKSEEEFLAKVLTLRPDNGAPRPLADWVKNQEKYDRLMKNHNRFEDRTLVPFADPVRAAINANLVASGAPQSENSA
jgi:Glycosyltransferase family 92